MYYYTIKIRLDGSLYNEKRLDCSAPEFTILQVIHGADAISEVSEVRNIKLSFNETAELKETLRVKYDGGLRKKQQSVDLLFGSFTELPDRIKPHFLELFGINEKGLAIYDVNATEEEVLEIDAPKMTAKKEEAQRKLLNIRPSNEVNIADVV